MNPGHIVVGRIGQDRGWQARARLQVALDRSSGFLEATESRSTGVTTHHVCEASAPISIGSPGNVYPTLTVKLRLTVGAGL